MDELYRKLLAQLEEGQDTVLAFITEGDGSIPRTTGAYMLVGREGRVFGTIGGGNLEYQAVLHAQELVQEKKSEYREYDLGTGEGKGLGMVCGGRVKVCFYFMNGAHGEAESLAQALAAQEQYCSYWIFFALDGTGIRVLEKEAWEMLPAAQEKAGHCRILELDGKTYYAEEFCYDGKVYLFGGGHLAQELVPVLHHLDFCCIVLDDREEYVDKALFPDAGQTMLVDFTKLDEILSIRKNDYLVIVTRGHRCDADAEAFALRTRRVVHRCGGKPQKDKVCARKTGSAGFYRRTARQCLCPDRNRDWKRDAGGDCNQHCRTAHSDPVSKNRKTKRCTSGASYVNIQNEESIIMKKKTVSILLTAAMALSLAACGSSNSTDSSSKSSSKAESTSASSASSEAESASSAKSTADGEVFDDTTVTVFAAKSLNSVMETLISEYNKTQPNVKLVGSYDSSGTLMTQIEEGASCDVFFSAAAKQMDQLEGENLLVEGTRHNIVNNQVCVVTYEGSNTEVTGLEDLNKASSIALADGSVPVGKYTREALVNAGILEKADDVSAITTQQVSEALGGVEINECANVGVVTSAVAEGSNEVGTVYYSDTYGLEDRLKVLQVVPYDLTGNVIYPAAQVVNKEADETEQAAAKDFVEFLTSDEAAAIFRNYYFDTEVE